MTRYKRELLLLFFALVIAVPVIHYQIPQHYVTPDIQYVKAKVLWVLRGDLFTDPVTGFPTFHPPYYHLFLSLFVRLGLAIDTILLAISVLNVGLLILFSHLVLKRVFDENTAFYTALIIPFVNQYMGPNYLFLASSFSFSVPLYLAGLRLYLKEPPAKKDIIAAALLWGAAFLVSPGYLFLIGLIFAYELLVRRDYLRFAVMLAVFLAAMIPFLIQARMIHDFSMSGTSTFALWRGWPDIEWFRSFIGYLLSPTKGELLRWHAVIVPVVYGVGLWGMIKQRAVSAYAAVAALAYILTFYHFNYQYASRIQFFLSIFLLAYAIRYLLAMKFGRKLGYMIVLTFILFSTIDHLVRTTDFYKKRIDFYHTYKETAADMSEHLAEFVDPGRFVLTSDKTYRYYIMPFLPIRNLLAYKTGEYFQVNTKLANEMLNDYNELVRSADDEIIDHFCRKYQMTIAVVGNPDRKWPVFRKIESDWEPVYKGEIFVIYKHP